MVTPNDITTKKFEKAAVFGYKVDDVDKFLEEVAESYNQVIEERNELEGKIEVLAEKLEEYIKDEENLRAALIGAQRLAESVIRDAKHKADVLIEDANIKAEKILEGTQRKIELENLALIKIQKEVTSFKTRLLNMYRAHIELISDLPEIQEEKEDTSNEDNAANEQPKQDEDISEKESKPIAQCNDVVETPISGFQIDTSDIETEEIKSESIKTESKYGPLKFGADYDFSNEDRKAKKRK